MAIIEVKVTIKNQQGKEHSCLICKTDLGVQITRYHCTTCSDFDICIECFNNAGHLHNMDLIFGHPRKTARQQYVLKYITNFLHAIKCKNEACQVGSCGKMKSVQAHCQSCTKRINGNCQVCLELIGVCIVHAVEFQDESLMIFLTTKLRVHNQRQNDVPYDWNLVPDPQGIPFRLLFSELCQFLPRHPSWLQNMIVNPDS